MKKIMAILLTILLLITGFTNAITRVSAEGEETVGEGKVTLTLIGSAIDEVEANKTVEVDKGTTVKDAIDSNYTSIKETFGSIEGYYIGDGAGWLVSSKPLTEFSDWKDVWDESFDCEEIELTENTQLYFILSKAIGDIAITYDEPVAGTALTVDDEPNATLNVTGIDSCLDTESPTVSDIKINNKDASNDKILGYEANVYQTTTVENPKLPAPENLTWESGFTTNGIWEWDHEDLYDDFGGYHYDIYWEKDGENDSQGGPVNEWFSHDFNVDHGGNSDFFNNHGEGYYRYELTAIPKDESGYEKSETVSSDKIYVYQLDFEIIVKDAEGNPISEHDCIVEHVNHNIEDGHVDFVRKNDNFVIEAVPDKGFIFEKFVIDGKDIADKETTITGSKSLTVQAIFKQDSSTATVTVDFGSKHAEFAEDVKDSMDTKYEASVENGVLTFKYPKAGYTEEDPIIYLEEVIFGVEDIQKDEEEFLTSKYSFGKKQISEYSGYEELDKEINTYEDIDLEETLDLYALWLKPVSSAEFEIKPLYCETEITVTQEPMYMPTQSPVPEVSEVGEKQMISDEERTFISPMWLKEPISEIGMDDFTDKLKQGKVIAGDKVYAMFVASPNFGYIVDTQKLPKVLVNNAEAENVIVFGSAMGTDDDLIILKEIEVEHKWIFDKFIWSKDNTAKANYICENEPEQTMVVEKDKVTIDDSDPKKLVATVSAEDSLDGQEHTGEISKVFNLYVQGVHVNGDNCDDILKNGTVKYNPETNTLTLNNATIEVDRREYGVSDKNEYGIRANIGSRDDVEGGTAVNKGLTIELIGSNKIVDKQSESDTIDKYGIVVTSQPSVTYKGGGSLDITVNSEGSNHYRGIELHQSATIDGVDITINMLGTASETNGMRLYYNNLVSLINNADVNINVGQGYAFDSDTKTNKDLFVEKGSIFEAISKGIAAVHGNGSFQIKEETMELGALVNSEASKEGAKVWDKESNLQNYKYLRIPEAAVLTIKWSSIDGDDLMDEIRVLATRGKTIAEACESAKLFEKEGYKAFGVFLDKSMSNYTNEMDMSEADLSGKTVDDDMTLYYPMIKEIKSVDLTLNPVKSGTHTSTPKNGDEWDYAKQTNRPDITNSSKEYSLVDEATIWVENFEDEPLTPYIGKFDEGTYKGATVVIPNFGYAMADDVKYNINGATFVKNDNLILYFTATVDSEYQNIKGSGSVWVKESNVSSEFIFKNDKDDSKTFSKFLGIKVDGMDVDKSKYDAVEGSVKIYLKPSYLETLSVGKHTLTAIFEDGQAEAVFTVVPKSTPTPTPQTERYVAPKTGVE